jgi:hypothetical protein
VSAIHSVHATGVEIEDIAMRQPNLDEVFTRCPVFRDVERRRLIDGR